MKEKLKNLFEDDRPFKERLKMAILIGFAVPYTFIMIGCIDLFVVNMGMFPFDFWELFWPVILTGLLCALLLTLLILIFKGKAFNIVVSLLLGLLVAGYVQGNYLNINLGQLTGDAINWNNYSAHSVFNTIIWIIIIFIPVAVLYFNKKLWKRITVIIPILLIGMQLAGTVSYGFSAGYSLEKFQFHNQSQRQFLSEGGMFELSSKNNVLVFIVDRFDGKYVDDVNAEEPGFFNKLDGFTYYPNHTSIASRTYPSVTYMLTGKLNNYDQEPRKYFKESYETSRFLPDLRSNNFTTKLYISDYYSYSDPEQLEGLADNLEDSDRTLHTGSMLSKMLNFSAYRYTPHAFKPSFWFDGNSFSDTVTMDTGTPPYSPNDPRLFDNLTAQGLSVQNEKDNFMYLHLNGCHAPYIMNEKAELVGTSSSNSVKQTKGVFFILNEYFKRMKELGLYDNATIIITGDHGKSEDSKSPDTYKTTALFVKPRGSSGTPLEISHKPLSHDNFQPTVLQAAGVSHEGYGKSIWEVKEDEDVLRHYYYKVDKPRGRVEEYEIRGDAEDFKNWKMTASNKLKYDY